MIIPLDKLPFNEAYLRVHLPKRYRDFSSVVCDKVESGHHANIYVLSFQDVDAKDKQLIVKDFFTPKATTEELIYVQDKDPCRLYTRETKAQDVIWGNIGGRLIAHPLGNMPRTFTFFSEYFNGPCLNDLLIEATNKKDWDYKKKILVNAVRNLARFTGRCNAGENFFDFRYYNDQAEIEERYFPELYMGYLARGFFAANKGEEE